MIALALLTVLSFILTVALAIVGGAEVMKIRQENRQTRATVGDLEDTQTLIKDTSLAQASDLTDLETQVINSAVDPERMGMSEEDVNAYVDGRFGASDFHPNHVRIRSSAKGGKGSIGIASVGDDLNTHVQIGEHTHFNHPSGNTYIRPARRGKNVHLGTGGSGGVYVDSAKLCMRQGNQNKCMNYGKFKSLVDS